MVYLERGSRYGQVVREMVEVQPMVEQVAARPSFLPLFRFDPGRGELLPSGYRPRNPEDSTRIFRTDLRGEGFIEEEIHEPDRVDDAARSGVGAPTLQLISAYTPFR